MCGLSNWFRDIKIAFESIKYNLNRKGNDVVQCWASSCLVTIHTTDDNFLKLFLSNHDDKKS